MYAGTLEGRGVLGCLCGYVPRRRLRAMTFHYGNHSRNDQVFRHSIPLISVASSGGQNFCQSSIPFQLFIFKIKSLPDLL